MQNCVNLWLRKLPDEIPKVAKFRGNNKIDKLIQDAQLNVNYDLDVIEWIPFDRFKDVKQIGKGGFGTVHYYARWIDGDIEKWDIENQQWKKYHKGKDVALKKFDNFMEIHFKIYTDANVATSIRFYRITQDPETHSYIVAK
ncbi:hypothetical protein Glove_164g12 [Diversispora epigaea]|uniref:Protein kinase domain-containing protein n=1 Tax=Diversispora epigaea TaxID=1348612 RepID=A0A397IR76_9GLOM|nr:hypothetical protein Glove_164g12 [Diversispora epigaea]